MFCPNVAFHDDSYRPCHESSSHLLPRLQGRLHGQRVQISDHDLIFGEIVSGAFPLLYPLPHNGRGDMSQFVAFFASDSTSSSASLPGRPFFSVSATHWSQTGLPAVAISL